MPPKKPTMDYGKGATIGVAKLRELSKTTTYPPHESLYQNHHQFVKMNRLDSVFNQFRMEHPKDYQTRFWCAAEALLKLEKHLRDDYELVGGGQFVKFSPERWQETMLQLKDHLKGMRIDVLMSMAAHQKVGISEDGAGKHEHAADDNIFDMHVPALPEEEVKEELPEAAPLTEPAREPIPTPQPASEDAARIAAEPDTYPRRIAAIRERLNHMEITEEIRNIQGLLRTVEGEPANLANDAILMGIELRLKEMPAEVPVAPALTVTDRISAIESRLPAIDGSHPHDAIWIRDHLRTVKGMMGSGEDVTVNLAEIEERVEQVGTARPEAAPVPGAVQPLAPGEVGEVRGGPEVSGAVDLAKSLELGSELEDALKRAEEGVGPGGKPVGEVERGRMREAIESAREAVQRVEVLDDPTAVYRKLTRPETSAASERLLVSLLNPMGVRDETIALKAADIVATELISHDANVRAACERVLKAAIGNIVIRMGRMSTDGRTRLGGETPEGGITRELTAADRIVDVLLNRNKGYADQVITAIIRGVNEPQYSDGCAHAIEKLGEHKTLYFRSHMDELVEASKKKNKIVPLGPRELWRKNWEDISEDVRDALLLDTLSSNKTASAHALVLINKAHGPLGIQVEQEIMVNTVAPLLIKTAAARPSKFSGKVERIMQLMNGARYEKERGTMANLIAELSKHNEIKAELNEHIGDLLTGMKSEYTAKNCGDAIIKVIKDEMVEKDVNAIVGGLMTPTGRYYSDVLVHLSTLPKAADMLTGHGVDIIKGMGSADQTTAENCAKVLRNKNIRQTLLREKGTAEALIGLLKAPTSAAFVFGFIKGEMSSMDGLGVVEPGIDNLTPGFVRLITQALEIRSVGSMAASILEAMCTFEFAEIEKEYVTRIICALDDDTKRASCLKALTLIGEQKPGLIDVGAGNNAELLQTYAKEVYDKVMETAPPADAKIREDKASELRARLTGKENWDGHMIGVLTGVLQNGKIPLDEAERTVNAKIDAINSIVEECKANGWVITRSDLQWLVTQESVAKIATEFDVMKSVRDWGVPPALKAGADKLDAMTTPQEVINFVSSDDYQHQTDPSVKKGLSASVFIAFDRMDIELKKSTKVEHALGFTHDGVSYRVTLSPDELYIERITKVMKPIKRSTKVTDEKRSRVMPSKSMLVDVTKRLSGIIANGTVDDLLALVKSKEYQDLPDSEKHGLSNVIGSNALLNNAIRKLLVGRNGFTSSSYSEDGANWFVDIRGGDSKNYTYCFTGSDAGGVGSGPVDGPIVSIERVGDFEKMEKGKPHPEVERLKGLLDPSSIIKKGNITYGRYNGECKFYQKHYFGGASIPRFEKGAYVMIDGNEIGNVRFIYDMQYLVDTGNETLMSTESAIKQTIFSFLGKKAALDDEDRRQIETGPCRLILISHRDGYFVSIHATTRGWMRVISKTEYDELKTKHKYVAANYNMTWQ